MSNPYMNPSGNSFPGNMPIEAQSANYYDYGGQVRAETDYQRTGHGRRKWFRHKQSWNQGKLPSETGSDSPIDKAWGADYTGTMYNECTGHTVPYGTVARAFYGTNPARNNGADIEGIPITPVRGQNWPEMQVQLKNGWGQTNFGIKLSYDDYLRLLTDSATKNRNYLIPDPAGIGPNAGRPGPAPANVNNLFSSLNQQTNPAGPGSVVNGSILAGRNYYG